MANLGLTQSKYIKMMEDHQLSEIGLQHGSFFCFKKHIFCASCELLPDSWDVDDWWWFPNSNHHFSMSSAIGCHTKIHRGRPWAQRQCTPALYPSAPKPDQLGSSASASPETSRTNHHGGWLKNICSTWYLQGIGVIWDNKMNHTYDVNSVFFGHMITLEGKNRQIPPQ